MENSSNLMESLLHGPICTFLSIFNKVTNPSDKSSKQSQNPKEKSNRKGKKKGSASSLYENQDESVSITFENWKTVNIEVESDNEIEFVNIITRYFVEHRNNRKNI